jgi:hypothetical protein
MGLRLAALETRRNSTAWCVAGRNSVKSIDRISLLWLAIAFVSWLSMAMEIPVAPSDVASICKGRRDTPRTEAAAATGPRD